MAELPILYSFRRCPYAMRARMALAISGLEVELREVVLRDKPSEMLTASSKGTVPVLVIPDGCVIDESLDIMHWALVQHDPEKWLLGNDTGLIFRNDGPFKAALDRYKYPHRYDIADPLPYRSEALAFLADLNVRLMRHVYLTGNSLGMADIAIFPFVRQFAATDQRWFDAQTLPALQRWLAELVHSPLFETAMRRYPTWRQGDVETVFP
jgi:glutathione S-transferase